MTLELFNDYPTTRSRYSPSNSPAAESLSQGSFIGARKPCQNTSFGRKGRLPVFSFSMTSGPRPRMDPAADEWAQTPGLCRRELNV